MSLPGRAESSQRARERLTTERYEIRIKGRVSEETAFAFDGLSVDARPVETVLHGDVTVQHRLDRAHIHAQAVEGEGGLFAHTTFDPDL